MDGEGRGNGKGLTMQPRVKMSAGVLQGAPRVTSGARRKGEVIFSYWWWSIQDAGKGEEVSNSRVEVCLVVHFWEGYPVDIPSPKSIILMWICFILVIKGVLSALVETTKEGLPGSSDAEDVPF